ncbi:uncharacterized protein LOC115980358 [Quercus lobata]|uniref:uncharacterized protein LOC115980358 n=1 Tax=Quercus lobata TaxID=97700 RepID=UPI001247350A|nr:uncharacterized protein LOC115980358 [Quercus lobata]
MWQQRSSVQWLKNRDQNTKFFHGIATQRKRKNFIKGLRDGNGVWQEDEEDLDRVLDGVNDVVTDDIRAELDRPFTSEEVGEAIKGMALHLKPLVRMSAFIADRLITDNILIAFESLHHMKNSCSSKKGFMAMKLDMSKAYDRVEWVFLEKILLKMGFADTWVALIMECITTVSYSILVNGEPKDVIVPSRGLRQGDPLSPYLFLFCAEGLNALLQNAANEGMINKEKTTLFFSRNTDEATQEALKVGLGVPVIKNYEKYLELPSFLGREVMIKAVVQSIPVYSMSVFKLPVGLCKDIEAMIQKFWWGSGDARKIHWVKWSSLCSSKSIGGMGFRDFQKFNQALLAKQSILTTRGVIEKGAIWRVGSGQMIDVWHHRWLPDLNHSKIISPYTNNDVSWMCDLFLPSTRTWDPGRLASCFLPWEADMVRKIQSLPSSSAPTGDGSVWKKIWKVHVPHKIRHFLWRAAKDSLPTKQNLVAWHIPVGNVCDGCDDYSESVMHALWLCDQVRSVWMTDPGFLFLVQAKCRTFLELLEVLFNHGSCYRVALFATVAWCLWQFRNRLRERQLVWPLHELGERAQGLVDEFWEVNPQVQSAPVRRPLIIGALRQNISSIQSVEMGEALAARRAVRFAAELCVFQVIIEGDCSRVIVALKGFDHCRTLFGHIIDESKQIGGTLRSCLFQHVRCEGNRLAHCLAKKAVLSTDTDVWVESLPEDVEDVFHSDLP